MNENVIVLHLMDYTNTNECWGREKGVDVYLKLLAFVNANPGIMIFKISFKGMKRMDISFASEAIVELAYKYRGLKGFCITDLTDADMIENLQAAAEKRRQPVSIRTEDKVSFVGPTPSKGIEAALNYALQRAQSKAADFAKSTKLSIANASAKFKKLSDLGYLLRREDMSETGGAEYLYYRIG